MPAKKNTNVVTTTTTTTAQDPKTKGGKLAEGKAAFLALLGKNGKMSAPQAKPIMGYKFNWARLCRELIEEGLIVKELPNKEEGEKYGQYSLTKKGQAAVDGSPKGKGKGGKRAAASTSAHKAGRPGTRRSCK